MKKSSKRASRDGDRPGTQERDSAAMELFSEVCRYGGTMQLNNAVLGLSRRNKDTVKYFGEAKFIEKYASKILKVVTTTQDSKPRQLVEARMPLKFCPEAAKGDCSLERQCTMLHLCPYYLKGTCSYMTKCRCSHDIKDGHTMSLLKALKLSDIDDVVWSELLKRVLQDTEIERGAASHDVPEICKHYNNEGGCKKKEKCSFLHICRHFVDDPEGCKFGEGCKRIHDLTRDPHNREIVKKFSLSSISNQRLLVLMRGRQRKRTLSTNSDSSCQDGPAPPRPSMVTHPLTGPNVQASGAASHDIPEICKHYNNEGGCKKKCPSLHVCRHFVDEDCKFGERCKRIHDLTHDPHNREIAQKFNLSGLSNHLLLALVRGRERKTSPSASSDSSIQDGPVQQNPKVTRPLRGPHAQASVDRSRREVEICGFHLKGKCNYGEKCLNLHCDLPYQWQYQEVAPNPSGSGWTDLIEDSNLKAENNFCSLSDVMKPFHVKGQAYEISFVDMVANPLMGQPKLKLRRVSTQSSEEAPPGHIFSTHWIWSWKHENGDWQSYDSPESGVVPNTTCSKSLEKDYLQGKDSHSFSAGRHSYILHYKKMFQRNEVFLTEREVIRRPEFVTKDKMKEIAQRRKDAFNSQRSSSISMDDTNLPSHWSAMEEKKDFCLVAVSVTSQEYKNAEKQFQATMSAPKTVIRVERIQNPDLWIAFAQKRGRMQLKASNVLPEEKTQLFHGTNSDVREAICQQGFDWRMCGKHGTAYGKGSYFACQASYSHRYTDHHAGRECYMFIARVLVGSFALGSGSLTRPPPKDSSKPHGELYDSCVNEVANPSIFVVFENNQCYPEYLITYR